MMIDDTQTPTGEETPKPVEETSEASDPAQANSTPNDETPAPAPAEEPVAAEDEARAALHPGTPTPPEPEPPAPADPQPDTPATPVEPPVPTPADPQPAQPPQPAPAAPHQPRAEKPAPANRADDAALFESYMNALESGGDDTDSSFKKLSKGDRIEATIIQVDKDKVFVDLGTKAEGVVPLHELTDANIESAHDHFSVGDKINVVVLRPEGGAEGNALDRQS